MQYSEIEISELVTLCNNRKIKWTNHMIAQMQARGINPSDIRHCIKTGEIIEQYIDDYPYQSCLIVGVSMNGTWLHVVVGFGAGYIWFVTAYYPNNIKWESDFKTRKVGIK